MTRLMVLDRGEELTAADDLGARVIGDSPLRCKLLAALPPFREADVLHIGRAPVVERSAAHGLLLCRENGALALRPVSGVAAPSGVLGAVTAVERGPVRVAVDRAPWHRLPSRYWSLAIDGIELARRLRHPLTPPPFQGSGAALLRSVRDKYDSPVETAQYGALATGELEASERTLVLRHVAPGGRLLDIGCGGGREAIGFARLGYRVVAIDIAPAMIATARRRAASFGAAVDFRVQSVTEVDDVPGAYDAAFFEGSLHHVPGRSLRIEGLRRVARSLTEDGVLILMVVYRERRGLLSRSRLVDAVRRAARRLGAGAVVGEPGDGYMLEVSEGSDPQRPCFFHHFDRPADVRGELEAAGFSAEETQPGWWICRKRAAVC